MIITSYLRPEFTHFIQQNFLNIVIKGVSYIFIYWFVLIEFQSHFLLCTTTFGNCSFTHILYRNGSKKKYYSKYDWERENQDSKVYIIFNPYGGNTSQTWWQEGSCFLQILVKTNDVPLNYSVATYPPELFNVQSYFLRNGFWVYGITIHYSWKDFCACIFTYCLFSYISSFDCQRTCFIFGISKTSFLSIPSFSKARNKDHNRILPDHIRKFSVQLWNIQKGSSNWWYSLQNCCFKCISCFVPVLFLDFFFISCCSLGAKFDKTTERYKYYQGKLFIEFNLFIMPNRINPLKLTFSILFYSFLLSIFISFLRAWPNLAALLKSKSRYQLWFNKWFVCL